MRMERKTISTLKMTDQDIPQTGPNSIPNQKKKKKYMFNDAKRFRFEAKAFTESSIMGMIMGISGA